MARPAARDALHESKYSDRELCVGSRTIDNLASDFDVLLASHKDQNIAHRLGKMNLENLLDRTVDVVFTRRPGVRDVDGESATWNCEGWSIAVEARELRQASATPLHFRASLSSYLLSVHRSGRDNELEISPSRQDCTPSVLRHLKT